MLLQDEGNLEILNLSLVTFHHEVTSLYEKISWPRQKESPAPLDNGQFQLKYKKLYHKSMQKVVTLLCNFNV